MSYVRFGVLAAVTVMIMFRSRVTAYNLGEYCASIFYAENQTGRWRVQVDRNFKIIQTYLTSRTPLHFGLY